MTHPYVDEILAGVVVDEKDGAKSALSEAQMTEHRTQLQRRYPEDKELYGQLVYFWHDFKRQGLLVLAEQLLELAQGGLEPLVLKKQMQDVSSLAKGKQAYHVPKSKTGASENVQKPTGGGVGLRKK